MVVLKDYIIFFVSGILCLAALFTQSHSFTDSYIVPKWLITLLVTLVIGLYCSASLLFGKSIKVNLSLIGKSLVLVCFLQAVYGLFQYFDLFHSHSTYKVTGSFDNPAGFAACLCAGLPFAGYLLLKEKSKYSKYLGWLVLAFLSIAVALSHSRAGIISIVAMCVLYLLQKLIKKQIWKYLLAGGVIILMFGCYWMKKDSADGRLLIWQCGLNMAKDALWTGHGIGSFEAHYMDYQADYFEVHQQDRFSLLADNVKQPFNEYLGVLLNFGIIGLLILSSIMALLIYCYKKNPNTDKEIAIYALLSIATFSLFSYPFTYPFIWIVTLLSIFVITREYLKRLFSVAWIKNAVCALVLICILLGGYQLIDRIEAEKEWNRVSMLASYSPDDKAISVYRKLERRFESNPYFLYNYAAVLLEMNRFDESLLIALQCRQYWADYDLELIIGENYQQLNQPQMAEKYYKSASLMCPSRFLPLYKLFHLHKENKEEQQALEIAEVIIDKPMKIETPTIRMMKREMERERNKALDLKLSE